MEINRKKNEDTEIQRRLLESIAVRNFPFTSGELVEEKRAELRQLRIKEEKAFLVERASAKKSVTSAADSRPTINELNLLDHAKKQRFSQKLNNDVMQFALQRYEQQLEQRRLQNETDMKNWKDRAVLDEIAMQKDRDIVKIKKLITNEQLGNQLSE
jgi:hypothetical protein